MMTRRCYTIGYEGVTQAEFIAALKAAGIARLIDVRAIAASRRPGFSKTILSNSLAEHNIGYVHLRALGTPAAGREAARAGRIDDLRRIYAAQLDLPEALVAAERLKALAAEAPSALLCYERAPDACHRSLLHAAVLPDWERIDLFA